MLNFYIYLIFKWLSLHHPPPNKRDLGITRNYGGIALTSTATKVRNGLLVNRIKPEIKKTLRKNQNGFRRNQSKASLILTIHLILEEVHVKNIEATLLFFEFSKAFYSIHRGKKLESIGSLTWWRHMLLRYCCWSFARRCITSVFVYYLPWLRTSGVD